MKDPEDGNWRHTPQTDWAPQAAPMSAPATTPAGNNIHLPWLSTRPSSGPAGADGAWPPTGNSLAGNQSGALLPPHSCHGRGIMLPSRLPSLFMSPTVLLHLLYLLYLPRPLPERQACVGCWWRWLNVDGLGPSPCGNNLPLIFSGFCITSTSLLPGLHPLPSSPRQGHKSPIGQGTIAQTVCLCLCLCPSSYLCLCSCCRGAAVAPRPLIVADKGTPEG